jgi:LAO/AO transport system kinase
VGTSAIKDQGIAQLVDAIEKHRIQSLGNGRYHTKRLQLCREELLALLRRRFVRQLKNRIDDHTLDVRAKRIAERRIDPYSEVEELAKRLGF